MASIKGIPELTDEISRKEIFTQYKTPFFGNDNISQYVGPLELDEMERRAAEKINELLEILLIDVDNDHNTKNTAARVAKMYVRELMAGRYQPIPKITVFPNAKKLDELYTVGPITVRSLCSHHLMPVIGECYIGVLPEEKIIGLSKFNRIVNWVMTRPQIQEEATIQIADIIQGAIQPRAIAVVIRAVHGCLTMRGVKDRDTKMTTSVMRGIFLTNLNLRSEFLSLIEMGSKS